MSKDYIEEEIDRRIKAAKELAKRFHDLKGLSYKDFLERTLDLGLELDFITSVEIHKILNEGA